MRIACGTCAMPDVPLEEAAPLLAETGRIWGRDDYDAAAAARSSYASMTRAFAEAGVERG